jgi:hypothetical protein
MMWPSSRRTTTIVLAVVLVALPAHAEPTPADRALATELFDQARDLQAHDKLAEACPKFQESQRLDPSPGTLLNLANCHEAEGRTATAWSEFNEALAVAEREGQSERVAFAESHIAALAPRLSRLIIVVPRELDASPVEITRDGTQISRVALRTAMPIDPGSHRVDVHAPGFLPWSTTIEIVAAERRELVVGPLVAAPAPLPPRIEPVLAPPAPAEKPVSRGRVAGLAVGGAGLLALGIGAVAGGVAIVKNDSSESHCTPRCSDEGYAQNRDAKTAADVATVSLLTGVVALGVGAVLFLSSTPPARARIAGDGVLRF